jgi:hypothetical protein
MVHASSAGRSKTNLKNKISLILTAGILTMLTSSCASAGSNQNPEVIVSATVSILPQKSFLARIRDKRESWA